MAGLDPRLSGLAEVPLEHQLIGTSPRGWFGIEEAIEPLTMHQVGADETGEAQRAGDGLLRRLRQAQEQEGDQRDADLNLDGVFAGAEEAGDLEGLQNSSIAQRRL